MALNSPGSCNNLKSPRSPRQLPKLPSQRIHGRHSPIQSTHNCGCKSPSTPRVFEFPPEYRCETANANLEFDDFTKSASDSRSSLLPESTLTGSTSNSSLFRYRCLRDKSSTGVSTPGSSPPESAVFQFCNPRTRRDKGYGSECPMSAGPLGPSGSPRVFFPQRSPKPLERARRNSCFDLCPMKNPLSPATIVTAPRETSVKDSGEPCADEATDSIGSSNERPTIRNSRPADGRKKQFYTRSTGISLNESRDSLPETFQHDGEASISTFRGVPGGSASPVGASDPRNVVRKSTGDLTGIDAERVETEATLPSSPRRRGSMKAGLAYLASRRGSRDSQITNVSDVSNEDVGPLNFNVHPRGRQRRTSNFLELPVPDHVRPRVHSLPEKAYNPRAGDDLYRLRAFSITQKGVVNRGDSIISRRSRSNTSVNSSRNSNVSGERSPFEGSCCSGQGLAGNSSESDIGEITKYRVVLLGDSGVGKTALVSQFMTSEYMNTYDASLDGEFGEKTVSILLDGEESEMIFIDHPHVEMSVENSLSTYEPHGCVVVYSVESRASFQVAEEILNYLWREHFTQERSVIVVGNKSDLERSRTIEANEGKHLATTRECKFIETSSGIQHNVDELLVGILKQIRLRETRDKKLRRQGSKGKILSKLHGSKTALSLNLAREILNKMCLNDSKSKSCENLHVL